MKFEMYSIKDRLSGYGIPIPFTNEEMAKRYFKVQLAENPIMKNTPEDFTLHYTGIFDGETGIYNNEERRKIM